MRVSTKLHSCPSAAQLYSKLPFCLPVAARSKKVEPAVHLWHAQTSSRQELIFGTGSYEVPWMLR